VHCKYLDVNHFENIQKLAQEIKEEKVEIDVLINNAGVCRVGIDGVVMPDPVWAKECLQTNLLSQIQITEALLPYLSSEAKVVSLSSKLGAIKYQPEHTQKKFSSENITKEDILSAAEEFVKEAEKGVFTNYSIDPYGTSKMLIGAWSRFVLQYYFYYLGNSC
jgi:NAD(P)-dependent dehydrogenase (short-subunit alcohol dehydrogenase family)